MKRRTGDRVPLRAKSLRKRRLSLLLAVHEIDSPQLWRASPHRAKPRGQLGAVGMGAIAIDDLDGCSELHVVSEHANHRLSFHDAPSQRVFGLVADDENRVSRIRCAMEQVMEDSPSFHHPRSGDQDHRSHARVQRL
jgi:hypothetical protein